MCDFSLQSVRSRRVISVLGPAGLQMLTTSEQQAVCLMPGTELAFAREIACLPAGLLGWKTNTIKSSDGDFSSGQQRARPVEGYVGGAPCCLKLTSSV